MSQTRPIPRSPDGDSNGVDDDYKDEVDQGAVQLLDVAAEADRVELSTVANISIIVIIISSDRRKEGDDIRST